MFLSSLAEAKTFHISNHSTSFLQLNQRQYHSYGSGLYIAISVVLEYSLRISSLSSLQLCTPTSDTQGVTPERTMLPPRSEKKRLVSRPLSPTHKRHKPAQSAQHTQPSLGVNTRLSSGNQDSRDVSPNLQPSQFNDSTKQGQVLNASALTHELVIRSRPLVAEVDYRAGEASFRPRFPYRSPVSEKLTACGHLSNAEEQKPRRADDVKAANDSTKPP